MVSTPMTYLRKGIAIALILALCCISFASADNENTSAVIVLATTTIAGNSSETVNTTETLPVTQTVTPGNSTLIVNTTETTAAVTPVQTTPPPVTTQTHALTVTPTPISTVGISPYNDIAYPFPGDPKVAWMANLTFPRNKKIDISMLLYIDPDWPVYVHGNSRETLLHAGEQVHEFMFAKDAEKKFAGLNGSMPLGDQVLFYIKINPSYSTHIADAYVTNVTDRAEEYHSLIAWVDVKNVDALASLEGVKRLKTTGASSVTHNSADDVSEPATSRTLNPGAVPTQRSPIGMDLIILGLLCCGLIIRLPRNPK